MMIFPKSFPRAGAGPSEGGQPVPVTGSALGIVADDPAAGGFRGLRPGPEDDQAGATALVDGTAEGDVVTILIPPAGLRALLIAEATLGERITRALILRRVQLIQAGHGGPLVIGDPDDAEVLRLATFLRRNGHPHKVSDPAVDPAAAGLLAHCTAATKVLPVVITPSGSVLHNPTIGDLGRALGLVGRAPGREIFDVAVVGAGPAGLAAAAGMTDWAAHELRVRSLQEYHQGISDDVLQPVGDRS